MFNFEITIKILTAVLMMIMITWAFNPFDRKNI